MTSISSWVELGCPKNTWFHITRQEKLSDCGKDIESVLKMLVKLIELTLQQYGKYKTREYKVINTMGNVNGAMVPVIMVSVEAMTIDDE